MIDNRPSMLEQIIDDLGSDELATCHAGMGARTSQGTFDRTWRTYPQGETLPSYRLMDETSEHLALPVTRAAGNAPEFALATGMRLSLVQPRRSQHELLIHLARTAAQTNLKVQALARPWDLPDGHTLSIAELGRLTTPASALAAQVSADLLRPIDVRAARRPEAPSGYAANPDERRVAAYHRAAFTWMWGLGVLCGYVLTQSINDPQTPHRSVTLGLSRRIRLENSGVHLRLGPDRTQRLTVTFPVHRAVLPSASAFRERLNQPQ